MAKGKDLADSILLLENFTGVWGRAGGRGLENKAPALPVLSQELPL